jgi:mono/diheme cytochrome c family protein
MLQLTIGGAGRARRSWLVVSGEARTNVMRSQRTNKPPAVGALKLALVACLAVEMLSPVVRGQEAADTAVAATAPQTSAISFSRDVQPILASKCIRCHGPETHEAGLRLDDRNVAAGRLESGKHTIVPGKPDGSELLRRVTADESERMPPEEPPLDPMQVATLRRWIAEGAAWPDHWAYQQLSAPMLPRFDDPDLEDWCRTPIDRFILAELIKRGLRPAPQADRRTLLRRLYFDIVGLPPMPEDVDAFLADESADAYEKVVNRLLASPQYGERWARHWMDVVHYADSHGFEHDMPRSLWPYRDYLVNAFNTDMPYRQFVREQVAGDAVAPDDPRALVATGFLATGPWDQSALQAGQMDTDDYRISQYLDRDDMVSTIMSTFVSSTVHCARCHDHKFDPISQTDYYALQAVVAGIDKAPREYDPDPAVARQRRELTARRALVQRQLDGQDAGLLAPELQAQVSTWQQQCLAHDVKWQVLEPIESRSANGADLVKQDDSSLISTGPCPDKDVYTITAQANLETIAALRLEVMADPSLPHGGPGRQENGNLHLTEFVVKAAAADDPASSRMVTLTKPQADFNQMPGWSIDDAIDNVPETGWGIYPEVGRTHTAVFELAELIRDAGPKALTFELHQGLGRKHLIGRVRLSVRGNVLPRPLEQSTFPTPVATALAISSEQRTDQQRMLLAAFYQQQLIDEQLDALPAPQSVYCGTNRFKPSGGLVPSPTPRPVHVLKRGEIKSPGALAEPGALRLIPELSGTFRIADVANESLRRVALADWLADPKNVLTWRSIVNRLWQYHFGKGLVDTPNDFGRMGSAPTHPELLDWLAVSMRENGGSMKAIHRLILTSAVYRQSSQHTSAAAVMDADNRYLSRMNTVRLDAESVRDAMLKLSGRLNPQMGGPPDKQFLEVKVSGMRPEADYQRFDVDNPANNRRSIYRFILRTMPDPLMSALDCPDGTQLAPTRNVSITALQALAMVNDKFVIRQSERLAKRLAAENAEVPAQVESLYRLLLCRPPSANELAAVTAYAEKYGLANACRFLLNTNEFVFVD